MNPTNFDNSQTVPQLSAHPTQSNPHVAFGGTDQAATSAPVTKSSHAVRNAILWIISGPVVLIALAVLSVFFRLLLALGGGVSSLVIVVNMLGFIGGLVGMLLLVIGPIVGIIILGKNDQ